MNDDFKSLLDKFNKEHKHKHAVNIRAMLENLANDPEFDRSGMTAQEIIKEIRKRQQE